MENSLKKAIHTFDLDAVKQQLHLFKEKSEPERIKSTIEKILRTKAISYGNSDASISELNSFIEFVITMAKEEICSKTLTIQILQDLFDVSTTTHCEEIFTIVETHIDIWRTHLFFESCKNMILRMCNDLLKRLSRTIDTTFCGRILILLAKSLPLNEKSGLNLTGQFNIQNATVYELEKKELFDESQNQSNSVDDDIEMGEIRENKDSTGAIPTDHNLYIKFWEMQKLFSNPNSLFEMNQFKQFENDILDIFGIFSAYKLEKPQRQGEQSPSRTREQTETNCASIFNGGVNNNNFLEQLNGNGYSLNSNKMELDLDLKTMMNKNIFENENTFFAKYLTSQKLFPLQLADSQFRRYFMLQFLIISNYLSSKAKLKESIDLTPMQENVLRELTDKCYILMRETYPHGSFFVDTVRKILSREKIWSNWKNENCPDLVGELGNNPQERKCATFKRKLISRYDSGTIDLGNRELSRLWNIEKDNLFACKSENRKCIPMLKPFLEDVLDEMDPEQQVEEQYQSVNDEKYQWMCNRFLIFNSDQYIVCALSQKGHLDPKNFQNIAIQEGNAKAEKPEKVANNRMNGMILRKAIQMTAENMPELKPKVEQILERIEQKVKKEAATRQAEEARLAARTKELEKRIKEEEEEQQKEEKETALIMTKEEKDKATTTSSMKGEGKGTTSVEHTENNNSNSHHSKKNTGEKATDKGVRAAHQSVDANSNDKDELPPPPKKKIRQDDEVASNHSGSNNSSRKKEKDEQTPEHGQRSGKTLEEKERKGGGGGDDSGDKGRKNSRKRHIEKSEERKTTGSGTSSKLERKGSGRSSNDRGAADYRSGSSSVVVDDRTKKRK